MLVVPPKTRVATHILSHCRQHNVVVTCSNTANIVLVASFARVIFIRDAVGMVLCAVVLRSTLLCYGTILNTTADQLPTTCWENT